MASQPGRRTGQGLVLVYDVQAEPAASLEVLLREHCQVTRVSTGSSAIRALHEAIPALIVAGLGGSDFERDSFASGLVRLHGRCPVIVIADGSAGPAIGMFSRSPISGIYRRPAPIGRLVASIGVALGAGRDWPSIGHPVGKALDYISQQYGADLTVASVAQIAGISRSRLAHLFQQELGSPVRSHIARVRIEIAKQALRTSSDTLEQIAGRLGFWDASHLSRLFFRYTNGRPGHYRVAQVG